MCSMISTLIFMLVTASCRSAASENKSEFIKLPGPLYDGQCSVERALLDRRSVRRYSDKRLTLSAIAQLLWAAQGVTNPGGFRTAPSAGALYPLEIYLVAGRTTDLAAGVYHYLPERHGIQKIVDGDKRHALFGAALHQEAVRNASAMIVFCGDYQRTTKKYGPRGIQYVWIEVGHASQNVCLQAVALGIGTVTIGAFDEDQIKKIVNCGPSEQPLYMMPIGWRNNN